jgi:hypothetical protein
MQQERAGGADGQEEGHRGKSSSFASPKFAAEGDVLSCTRQAPAAQNCTAQHLLPVLQPTQAAFELMGALSDLLRYTSSSQRGLEQAPSATAAGHAASRGVQQPIAPLQPSFKCIQTAQVHEQLSFLVLLALLPQLPACPQVHTVMCMNQNLRNVHYRWVNRGCVYQSTQAAARSMCCGSR